MPGCVAKRAMIFAGVILIAGELAIGAERYGMEPVAVSINVIFGDIFVPSYIVGFTEIFGLLPGFRLDTDELDIASVGVLFEESMTKFVKEFERSGVVCVIESGRRGKLRT